MALTAAQMAAMTGAIYRTLPVSSTVEFGRYTTDPSDDWAGPTEPTEARAMGGFEPARTYRAWVGQRAQNRFWDQQLGRAISEDTWIVMIPEANVAFGTDVELIAYEGGLLEPVSSNQGSTYAPAFIVACRKVSL